MTKQSFINRATGPFQPIAFDAGRRAIIIGQAILQRITDGAIGIIDRIIAAIATGIFPKDRGNIA